MTIETRIQRHPHMRASTLAYLQKRDDMTSKLRAEVEAMRRVNSIRDEMGYEPGVSALLLIAGRLKVLALRAKEILQ